MSSIEEWGTALADASAVSVARNLTTRPVEADRGVEADRDADAARRPTRLRRDALYRRGLMAADLSAGFGAVLVLRVIDGTRPLGWDLLAAPAIVVVAKLLGNYDRDRVTIRRSTLDEVPSLLTLAAILAVLWSLLQMAVGMNSGIAGGGVGLLWLLLSALLVGLRAGVRAGATRLSGPERVLVVGAARPREALAHSLSTDPGTRLNIVGYLPLEDERLVDIGGPNGIDRRRHRRSFADLEQVANNLNVDRVVLVPGGADSDRLLDAITATLRLNLDLSLVPRTLEVVGSAVEFDNVGGVTLLGIHRPGLSRSSRAIKRTMDVAGAGLALAMFAPLFIGLAVAVKLDSRGPVLFRQRRVGRDGRVFDILKFRSMVDDAESQRHLLEQHNETHGLFKMDNDPRVTRVGRLLRRCSLDELPQLLNVLAGDMSLVGPRPLVLAEDALIEGRHRERLTFAPGMTGAWQVLGPSRPPLAEMVKTDYLYAVTWSLWLDIKILLRTVSHIRSGRGR